jgi:GNAT superfamily N-acetyltransferase
MPSLAKAFQKAKGSILPFGFIPILGAMKKNDRADLLLVAIHKDYQSKGINAILIKELYDIYQANNIQYAEAHPQLETNKLIHAFWKHFDARQHKKRTCFIKHLE